jgi:probable rRNA maturation factor
MFFKKGQCFLTAITGTMGMKKTPISACTDSVRFATPIDALNRLGKRIYSTEKILFSRATHVIFCSDYRIRKLNARFRKKNRATDVLSFNYDDPDLLGEIYISVERAGVQARRYQVTLTDEILRLFVHGMFHLLGFDHETEHDRRKMEAKEFAYLQHP